MPCMKPCMQLVSSDLHCMRGFFKFSKLTLLYLALLFGSYCFDLLSSKILTPGVFAIFSSEKEQVKESAILLNEAGKLATWERARRAFSYSVFSNRHRLYG